MSEILSPFGIEEVYRFVRSREIRVDEFEQALLHLKDVGNRLSYHIIATYFDLGYAALIEARPKPTARDVAREMFTTDVEHIESVIDHFCQTLEDRSYDD